MKRFIVLIALTIVLIHVSQPKAQISHPQSKNLVFEATVEKIGYALGVGSGFHAVYQLAKYKVLSVCEGEYDQREIVVDHLMMYGNELDHLRVGDKVRVVTEKSKTIFSRNNEEGFRAENDKVDVFYIGEKPTLITSNCVRFEPCK